MSYEIKDIKVLAYNRDFREDFTVAERNLFCGLAYCYDWFRLHPEDKDICDQLSKEYQDNYLYLKQLEGK